VCKNEDQNRGIRDLDPETEGVRVDGQLDGPWLFGDQPRGKWGRTAYWRLEVGWYEQSRVNNHGEPTPLALDVKNTGR
jgi:hypothetical protein